MPGVVALLVELCRWLVGFGLLWRRRSLPEAGVGADDAVLDDVAVVIPARNEEGVVGGLLQTLPGRVEVVVVDDGSDDATAAEARGNGAVVLDPGPPPEGWTGKSWACAAGARATSKSILVFIDADVRLGPGAVSTVAEQVVATAGVVSVQPHHLPGSPAERLSAYFNVVALMGVGPFAVAPLAARAAFGPVLALPRALYDSIGGHEAVRGEILDDVSLGAAVRAAGGAVRLHTGGPAVTFRMYPRGLSQLGEGWTKNFAAGAGTVRLPLLVAVIVWLSGVITAAASPALALAGRMSWAWAGMLYVAYAAQSGLLFRRAGRFGVSTALLFPVPLLAFLVVFSRSVLLTMGVGRVTWRGRTVRVRDR